MLVISRRINEGLVIADNIHIRVLDIDRRRVKLGVSAPTLVTVLRDELLEEPHPAKAASS